MGSKLLIVDDSEISRELLAKKLRDEYEILAASGGTEAMNLLTEKREEIAAVFLDILMPEPDGFAVLAFMKQEGIIGKIPVLIISAETSSETEIKCFEMGAVEFIGKPFDGYQIKNRLKNILKLYQNQEELEKEVERQTQTIKRQYDFLQKQTERLRENNDKIIEILATVIEYRNVEHGMHIQSVKKVTRCMAEQMMERHPEYGLTAKKIDVIVAASALHDIGKISIPDHILLKPGKLTEEETSYLNSHTIRGAEIIEDIDGIWDKEYKRIAKIIARSHHERFDGNGYPDGLSGTDIPIEAQIVSIADAYDVLISERNSKQAYTKEEAIHMIISGESGVFSPQILACFRKISDKLMEEV